VHTAAMKFQYIPI